MAGPALAYAADRADRFVDELTELVRIPSVSADPACAAEVRRCAEHLAAHLARIGMDGVRLLPTPGHPAVHAAWRRAPGRPTLLVYGHYDVQPAGRSGWLTSPFAPVVRGEHLVGRGASDDKGPLFAHVKALESWLAATGRLPLNVVCLFEGEEETGSRHLPALLRRGVIGPADGAVVSDTRMLGPDRPAITYALRGSLTLEIEVRALGHDLHPGAFGGAVPGGAEALCRLLGRLHERGRVAVPGFYDGVRPLQAPERAALAETAPDEAELLAVAAAGRGAGEPGYTAAERTTIRPALHVTRLRAGQGGSIPARAVATVNARLVPDQDPAAIDRQVRAFVAAAVPAGVRATVRTLAAAPPVLLDVRHRLVRAAAAAYARAFGAAPALVRSGGTIPAVAELHRTLPVVLMGFALPDDRMHGPNERLHLPTFHRAVAACIHLLAEAAS